MRSLPLAALALLAATASAQDRYTRRTEIISHVNEPDKLAPTPERLDRVKLPEGFRLTKFASVSNPRWLVVNTDGTAYVSSRNEGVVYMLKDTDSDGVADVQAVVFKREKSHGLAIHKGSLYVVTVKEIFRAAILKDGFLGKPKLLRSDLPDGGQHQNRTIAFGPDGMMYVSVGSTANATMESDPRSATMLRFDENAQNGEIFASGLRNTIGFGWHPVSKRFFGMDHGIDWLGDNDQREEFNEILRGRRYGWPYIYADGRENPQDEPPAPFTMAGWKAQSVNPLLLHTAHSAPMASLYYTGSMFPPEYRNDELRAMRGSWNRVPASGYEIIRVRYDASGAPQSITPFLTGFLQPGERPPSDTAKNRNEAHIGRLCGIAQAKDGAVLFTDDANNIIYRISYGQEDQASMEDQDGLTFEKVGGENVLKVRLGDIQPTSTIPLKHTAYGEDRSPFLIWGIAPAGTKSFAIVMEDPDSLSPKPFVHWLAADISPTLTGLKESVPKAPRPSELGGGVQGAGHAGVVGYFGPKPPASDPAHRYHFEVYALDAKLKLPPGFTRHALLKAMQGHVLAKGETVREFKKEG